MIVKSELIPISASKTYLQNQYQYYIGLKKWGKTKKTYVVKYCIGFEMLIILVFLREKFELIMVWICAKEYLYIACYIKSKL